MLISKDLSVSDMKKRLMQLVESELRQIMLY